MTKLEFDKVGERHYSTGIDHGVLYLPDGTGIAWNGLVAIEETLEENNIEPVYFNGVKINALGTQTPFRAILRAFTYPDEFLELEGFQEVDSGMFVDNQKPKTFNLAYRSRIGNDVDGPDHGFYLHFLYNLNAIPSDTAYNTLSDQPEPILFEWAISSIPIEITGFRPTAHVIIDSRYVDPFLLRDILDTVYGTPSSDPALPDPEAFLAEWVRFRVINNGDGTWTAIDYTDEHITMLDATTFEIDSPTAVYIDAESYTLETFYEYS